MNVSTGHSVGCVFVPCLQVSDCVCVGGVSSAEHGFL